MTGDLVAFLKARLAEDEQMATAATQGPWFWADHSTDAFPQGDHSLLADEPTPDWQTCAHYCTWSGEENLHRGTPGQPGHQHRMVTEVIGSWGHDAWGIDVSDSDAAHIARWDPVRVLAEVQAKRRIVDEHFPEHGWCRTCTQVDEFGSSRYSTVVEEVQHPCPTLRLLALPYAGHDSYQAEWAPDTEVNRG